MKTQKMLDALWGGQCNCAYWHGVFRRDSIFLISRQAPVPGTAFSRNTGRQNSSGAIKLRVVQDDFDKDGRPEILVEAPQQNLLYIPSQRRICWFKWDLRKEGINLQNADAAPGRLP